jgi:hypothetical protein
MASHQQEYDELCCYKLAHGDPSFIHQHVVDAYAAQTTDSSDKPIRLTFALVGLYLHVDKQLSGKQVQRVHMLMARRKTTWPSFPLPADRGSLTAADVLAVPPGTERDKAIDEWCRSVWNAFRDSHQSVKTWLSNHLEEIER